MRTLLFSLVAVSCLCAAEPAAPVARPSAVFGLAADSGTVPAFRLVRIDAANVDPAAAVVWDVSPDGVADIEEQGRRLVFTGPPGTYSIRCLSIKLAADGKTEVKTARQTVTILPPPGPPTPVPPAPGPVVPPAPRPPTPVPADLAAKLRAAHDRDKAAGRGGDRARIGQYADAFDSGASLAVLLDPARAVGSAEAVMVAIRNGLAAVGFPGINEQPNDRTYMRDVRTVAMSHVAASFPNGTAPLSEADRSRLSTCLGEIASSVRSLGQ